MHCQSEILLDSNTRKALKSVKTHNTLDDSELFVAYPPDPNEKYYKKKEPQLKGGALALSKKAGIRFTSYSDSSAGKEGAD